MKKKVDERDLQFLATITAHFGRAYHCCSPDPDVIEVLIRIVESIPIDSISADVLDDSTRENLPHLLRYARKGIPSLRALDNFFLVLIPALLSPKSIHFTAEAIREQMKIHRGDKDEFPWDKILDLLRQAGLARRED